MNITFSDLTALGKCLLVPVVLVVFATAYYATPLIKEQLPRQEYGGIMGAAMIGVGLGAGLAFFALVAVFLRIFGLRVIKPAAVVEDDAARVARAHDLSTGLLRRYRVTTAQTDGQWIDVQVVDAANEDEARSAAIRPGREVAAIEELPHDTADQPPARPELFDPESAIRWSAVLTPILGAYLHAVNWRVLGDANRARANMVWVWGTLIYLVAVVGALFAPGLRDIVRVSWWASLVGCGTILFAWKYVQGNAQVEYVERRLGDGYPKRSLGGPLLLGVAAFGVYVACCYFLVAAAYTPTATALSAEIKPLILEEWRKQPETKWATIEKITLNEKGSGEYTGFVHATVGGRVEALPIEAKWYRGKVTWTLGTPPR